jgi:phosphoglycolate phosphatase
MNSPQRVLDYRDALTRMGQNRTQAADHTDAMAYRTLICDFDGTLADSFECALDAFDAAAGRFGFDPPDRTRIATIRQQDARQILAHHRVPLWKLPFIARYVRKFVARNADRIVTFPGIEAALTELADRGATLALLTSNSQRNVTRILGTDFTDRFRLVESGAALFGKAQRLKRLLRSAGIAPQEALFIGDEIRDAAAARYCGVRFGAVGWGYTSLESLLAYGADETFRSVEELSAKLSRERCKLPVLCW